ncbi:2'-deoxycytidine 5'-triphosphate deaminase [Candidatus Pacearchaeota archaeon]|nr:2'-deoxycytidine 5'-triphosphate deaminase [Candidatus Pacearchaeota archaeon]
MDQERGYSLVSQQIRKKILDGDITNFGTDLSLVGEGPKKGQFKDDSLELRIQPASMDPIIGNEIYVLDTETQGLLRPDENEEIYRTLVKIPKRQRQKFDITSGYEIKRKYSYLLPLEEKVILNDGEWMKSSPKSSAGRIFLNTRMFTDHNPGIDEAHSQYLSNTPLRLWLLLQPLTFNAIIYPGLSFNQLRFFKGSDSKLSSAEVTEEFKRNPLLLYRNENDELVPPGKYPIMEDGGLQVKLDLKGKYTDGVVGLKTRNNPTPIELNKKDKYDAEDYFEPIISRGDTPIISRNGDHTLFASQGVLRVPRKLSAEVNSFSNVGITGPLDFAGFVDNGFRGDLVFEIRSDEISGMRLRDGMPLTGLEFHRTSEDPDKEYGEGIGSNYYGQIGPKTAKYFKKFDFTAAAKNYKKLDRIVLVEEANRLKKYRKNAEGFEPIDEEQGRRLVDSIETEGFGHSRYDCENDESVLQVIPYVAVMGPNGTVFSYVRASDINDYGDARLFGKHSVGVGGHVHKSNGKTSLRDNMMREVDEELKITGNLSEPKLLGTLVARDTAVDRVHFGLIYATYTDGKVEPGEAALASGRMMKISEIIKDPVYEKKYETWSRIIIPYLSMFGKS